MGRLSQKPALSLPPRGTLPKPEPDDPLDYYYRPLTAPLYRARLRLALRLLGGDRFESLLEVGYGSGILLPELARRAGRVAAIDIHPGREAVEAALEGLEVQVDLRDASLFDIPYPADEFEALICLSVLEHLTDLDAALSELARVVRPGGVAVIGFPVRNPITDNLFRALGYDPRKIHPSSHGDIIAAARSSRSLELQLCAHIPPVWPRALSAYVACRLGVCEAPGPRTS